MIEVHTKGTWGNIDSFFKRLKRKNYQDILDKYGMLGVEALSKATPVRTGLTAASWKYETEIGDREMRLTFHNTNIQKFVKVAIVVDQGHATARGGWVEGRHYIEPAILPVLEELKNKLWKEVME
jgi:hypothetical protein